MHGLFQDSNIHRVINNPPKWHYVKTVIQKNISKIVDYYQYALPAVHLPHILARLIGTDSTPYSLDSDEYVDCIGLENTKPLGMTSNYMLGKEHIGGFYNDQLPHYLLAHNEYFNPFDAISNWKKISPVVTMYHPYVDLECLFPNGKLFTSSNEFSVISINVPMLLLQHKLFIEDQRRNDTGDSNVYGTANYLSGYVLANMLEQQMDIAIFNRLLYTFKNGHPPHVSVQKKYQMALVDVHQLIDDNIKVILDNISKCDGKIDTILKMIPAISKKNMYEVLNTPDVVYNQQNHWLIILSQLKYFNGILSLAGTNGIKENKEAINHAYTNIIRNATVASMRSVVNNDIYLEAIDEINKFTQLVNRKF